MPSCIHQRTLRVAFLIALVFSGGQAVEATDYFLTIGGGYSPSGNQASLEENNIFFQQVLKEKHSLPLNLEVYFADGSDPAPDLQVLAPDTPKVDRPATDLLASLYRRRGQEQVEYRNHRVPNTVGPLDPKLIRESLESLAKTAKRGDRLIVYVTAHGSEGPEDDEFNTTIDCWDDKEITAREFSGWLNKLPSDVPIVMVMAQCYCGGFARMIFNDLDAKEGLNRQRRVGFFAQQHNLPAAGCRPDIEHDEEFSSYFWGAIAGRSRNGVPKQGCDIDGNGVVSFAEAYAHAFTVGETIDIPLKTSDVFLRAYSKLPESSIDASKTDQSASHSGPAILKGTIQSIVDQGHPVARYMVLTLCKTLGISPGDNAASVVVAYERHVNNPPGRGRRRGPRSLRRDLLKEIEEKWPELGDARKWEQSSLLADDNQQKLLVELKELPTWKAYDDNRRQSEELSVQSEKHELREVKYRRLIKSIELILLEKNLPQVASPEIVARYRQLISLEESSLSPDGHGRQ